MRMLPILVCMLFTICFADVLFSDDFNDGDDNGWTHIGAASFDVTEGEYIIYSQGASTDYSLGKSVNGDDSGVMSTSDYSVVCSITMECGNEAGVLIRYTGPDQFYYRMVIKPFTSRILLERKKDSGPTIVLDEYSFPFFYNTRFWIRFQADGDALQCRIWSGSIDDEPDIWHIDAVDSAQPDAGSFGLLAGGYGKVSWSSKFDDVIVSTPVSQEFSQVSWASIKLLVVQ